MLSCTILRFYIVMPAPTKQHTQISLCTQEYINDNKGVLILKLESNPQPPAGEDDLYNSRVLLDLRKLPMKLVLRKTPAWLHFHHGCTFERRLFELRRVDVLLKGTPLSFLICCCSLLACASAYQTPFLVERKKRIFTSLMVFCVGNKTGVIFTPLEKKNTFINTRLTGDHQLPVNISVKLHFLVGFAPILVVLLNQKL